MQELSHCSKKEKPTKQTNKQTNKAKKEEKKHTKQKENRFKQ
jgi:hypothetical protein